MPIFPNAYEEKPTPDGDDKILISDTADSSEVKSTTFSGAVSFLQSAIGWIQTNMLANSSVTSPKLDYNSGIWWEELGRVSLGSASDNISLLNVPARKYLQVKLVVTDVSVGSPVRMNFNSGSGSTYAYSNDGTSTTSQTHIQLTPATTTAPGTYLVDITNSVGTEKQAIYRSIRAAPGASGVIVTSSGAGKWANTADSINRVAFYLINSAVFSVGTELIVLGHD